MTKLVKLTTFARRDDIRGTLNDCLEFSRINADLRAAHDAKRYIGIGPDDGEVYDFAREYNRLNKIATNAACR